MEWFKKRDKDEVEKLYNEIIKKSKGEYVTRSVSFKKSSPEQMELLKKTLSITAPFSMLVRTIIEGFSIERTSITSSIATENLTHSKPSTPTAITPIKSNDIPNKSIGNFI